MELVVQLDVLLAEVRSHSRKRAQRYVFLNTISSISIPISHLIVSIESHHQTKKTEHDAVTLWQGSMVVGQIGASTLDIDRPALSRIAMLFLPCPRS